jgi:hypothetical protein
LANYYVGTEARLSATFRDSSGTLGDPSSVVVMVKDPAGSKTTYTTATGVVRDSLGAFHLDITLTKAGSWVYKWKGSGGLNAASPDSALNVAASVFGNA